MDSLLAVYGYEDVLTIRYHGDTPWEFDPFYVANPTEIDERYSYYSIELMPANFLDGAPFIRSCYVDKFRDAFDEQLTIASPLKMVASDSLTPDSCFVDLSIIAEGDPGPDSLVLRAAVIEDNIYYEAPNSQTLFNCVFRSFLPDPGGTVFTIAQGETLDFEFAFELDPAWDAGKISVVLFAQDDTDKSVHQAVSSRDAPPGWARYSASECGRVEVPGHEAVFPSMLLNLGAATDTFDIVLSTELPADWSASYTVSGGVPLGGAVGLARDSSCAISIEIDCGYEAGTGEAIVTVTSRQDTGFVRNLRFFAVSGVCAVLIDDDGGLDYEHYYEEALDSIGVVWGIWDRRSTKPQLDDLNRGELVIWFTGEFFPTLDAHDQDLISSYLDGGGNLFMTGQDIGYALCYAGTEEYSIEARMFYETYLHAEWIMPNANLFALSGRTGDPISDGITLSIEGGDGADNQDYPDVIDSIAPAGVIFDYVGDPLKHGGVRFEDGSSKLVYLSFGFEAISTREDRELLMSRIVNWFGKTSSVNEITPAPIISFYPNPATTHLSITLGDRTDSGGFEVYDILGRLVMETALRPSEVFVWDLKDTGGHRLAPGVYFVSVSTEANSARRKIVLTR